MDTRYMEILERLKTRHLLTSSAVDSLAKTSALLEKAQELRAAGPDYGDRCTELSGEVRPDYVIIENSPLLRKRGFEYVLHGLSEIGYDAQWQCLQGSFLGLQQRRERIYISLPTPCVSSAKGSPRNRFFGSPIYRGNFHEYIRDGESDGTYPNPELSEALMSFPISWTETNV